MTGKRTNQRIAFWIFRILGLIVVGILFWILGFIIWHGAGVINWKFLTTAPTDGMTGGGIFPAIVGTFCLIAGSMVVAFPLGVMSAIYTTEYAGNGKIVRFIRIMTNNLGSIPSIIFGLFGMALFVNALGFGDSIIAGSFTLGLLALPLVIRTTEEALKAVPDSYRTGSLALGEHGHAHGLARAVRAEQPHDAAGGQADSKAIERHRGAIALSEVAALEQGRWRNFGDKGIHGKPPHRSESLAPS